MIEVYIPARKIHGGRYKNSTSSSDYGNDDERMRGNEMKLMKRSCNGQIRANVFGNSVCSAWNSLPQDDMMAA